MQRNRARDLMGHAEIIAERLSLNRERNTAKDDYGIDRIVALSENTAAVIFIKTSGKSAITFHYFILMQPFKEAFVREDRAGHWRYFIPTDSHLLGMAAFPKWKAKVERDNYDFNFNYEDKETK